MRLFLQKMALKPFQFKQFKIAHDRSTHKVGTDAVLLGSWVNILETDKLLLDIGTGSGVIALMLAQRTKEQVHIDALDILDADVQQARYNVANSPWPQKIDVRCCRAQTYFPERQYDLIVSNPPYFEKSLLPPEQKRSTARHGEELSFPELLTCASRLMSPSGRFAVILPHAEGLRFIRLAAETTLFPSRQTAFRSRRHKPIERLLLEFCRQQGEVETSELTLYDHSNNWTDGYRLLTKDFYLKADN